jgi:hypothetical protein
MANRRVRMGDLRFGGGIKPISRQCGAVGCYRREVHDAAITARLHVRDNSFGYVNKSIHVGAAHAFHAGNIKIF